jgi:DNA polymerase elongation subunit (family B)
VDTIDLYELYSYEVKDTQLSRYTLEEVAVFEGVVHKIERDKPFHQMSKDELEEYNRRDAQILVEIEEKYGFVEQKIELANEINWFINILSPSRFGDALVLRKLRELGYVAPTRYEVPEKSYKGGYVKEPKVGVFEKIVVFDINSLYPNIIVNNKIDVANLKGECLPEIIRHYLTERQNLKQLFKETKNKKYDIKQKAVKILANSLYGLFGLRYFRFYDAEKAGTITRIGRETIQNLEKFMKDLGYEVLYADTDSVFIQVEDLSIVSELESLINTYIAPYTAKVDYIFEKVLFFGTEEKATKKRYYGITAEGKEIVKGIELRRRDWCGLTKKILHDMLRLALSGVTKQQFILKKADYKRRLYRGEFDEDLIITKSVRAIDEYKVNQMHVKALKKALERGYPNMGKISYIITRGGNVEPVLESLKDKPDYRWYWKHQILPALERVEKAVWSKKGKQQHLNIYY